MRIQRWARYIFREDQGRQGQVTLTEPLNRGRAAGQKQMMTYIKVSISDVQLLTETDRMLAPD